MNDVHNVGNLHESTGLPSQNGLGCTVPKMVALYFNQPLISITLQNCSSARATTLKFGRMRAINMNDPYNGCKTVLGKIFLARASKAQHNQRGILSVDYGRFKVYKQILGTGLAQ